MRKIFLAIGAALTLFAGSAFSQMESVPPGVYNVEVISVRGNLLSVRVEGQPGRFHYRVPPNFTFDIDGDDITYKDLVPKQKLRAYVTPEMIAPHDYVVEDETIIIAVIVEEPVDYEEEIVAVVMPSTASLLPLAALLGSVFLGLGFIARRLRR